MKAGKDARRIAKQLLRACFVDEQFDEKKALHLVRTLVDSKPRHYLQILAFFERLVRLEIQKRSAVVETAAPLQGEFEKQIRDQIKGQYPQVLRMDFKQRAELLGGMRLRIGSDVWDNTIAGRLEFLKQSIE